MITYRCYLLDDEGRIKRFELMDCPTDAVALEKAAQRLATCGYPMIEVWDKGRRVGTVSHSREHLERKVEEPEQRA